MRKVSMEVWIQLLGMLGVLSGLKNEEYKG